MAMVGLLMNRANGIDNNIRRIRVLRCNFDHFFRELRSIYCDFQHFGCIFSACVGTRGLGVNILRNMDVRVLIVWLIFVRI